MLQGKGMFIWEVQKCDAGDPARLVALARAAQISHVILKLTDGTFDFPLPAQDTGGRLEQMTDSVIRAFQKAGLAVWALTHTQGADPAMEAHRAASRVLKWNLDGIVVSPQSQYVGQHDRAARFMSTLRQDLGSQRPIAFSLFHDPDSQDQPALPHSRRFPVDEFAGPADILMPQVYWIALDGGDPAAALRGNYEQYRRRYPDKPYVPTGAAFGEQYGANKWSATPQQIQMFLNQVRALNLPAVNFWSWQHARNDVRNPYHTGTQLWDAVATYPWPPAGDAAPDDVQPPEAADPFADLEEIIPPGDGRYLDGIYGRFSTIRFSTMAGRHGPVKYAVTHPTHSTLWAQWTPGIVHPGKYEIAVWVPGTHATTRRGRYHIRGVTGQDSTVMVELDQSRYYDKFVPLGIFDLDSSRPDAGAVNLTNLTGESGREIAFSPIRWRYLEADQPASLADGYDAPVGTGQERALDRIWPGAWVDALGFGTRYRDSEQSQAYHTGADLNLNTPRWDADRGAPVWSIASGTVTFAGRLEGWGQVVVIRHDPTESEGNAVWARYAHVDRVQVRAGDQVARGQQIAVIGKPEAPDAPYHLHFDICTSGVLEQSPGHWPRLDYYAVITHYVDPRDFLQRYRPPAHLRRG